MKKSFKKLKNICAKTCTIQKVALYLYQQVNKAILLITTKTNENDNSN